MAFEREVLRKIFGPTYETGSWRIKTNKELDKLIRHKNITKLRQSAKVRMVWSY